jgi:outer membrane protein assembly factor BamB
VSGRRGRGRGRALLFLAAACAWAPGLRAQFEREGSAALSIPVAGGEWNEELARTQRAFAEGRLNDGLTGLRVLLGDGAGALIEVEEGRYMSVDLIARDRVAALTVDEKDAFAALFRELSEQQLRAWKDGDETARAALARELMLTSAGRSALDAEAAELFEAGAFRAAEETWRFLAAIEGGGAAERWRRIGLARLFSGDVKGCRDAAAAIAGGAGEQAQKDACARFLAECASAPWAAPRPGQARGVAVFDTASAADGAKAPFTRGAVRWKTLRLWGRDAAAVSPYAVSEPCRRFAVAFDNRVYATDGVAAVYGFDAATGKLAVQYASPLRARLERFDHVEQAGQSAVVTDDYVVGTFVVRVEEPTEFHAYSITEPIPYRSLFVFSRRDQTLAWRSDVTPGLEQMSIVGAPLLRGDVLYAAGWIKEGFINVYAMALDVRSGNVLWRRLVCGSQLGTTMFGEMANEPYGMALGASGDLVYVATHMGTVAALRRTDGTIRWLTAYETIPVPVQFGARMLTLRPSVWTEGPMLVRADTVAVAPRDSRLLLLLDARTGAVAKTWRATEPTVARAWLLGVQAGTMYAATERTLYALEAESLNARQLLKLAPAESIAGRPALVADGVYFLQRTRPTVQERTATGRADRIELWFYGFDSRAKQKVAGQESVPLEAGNVAVAGNLVLVTSERMVTAFARAEEGAP